MKTLVIIRHAHRDKASGRDLDNGLSSKGRKQARRARDFFEERFGKRAIAQLISSPKRRCVETLEPIGKLLGTEVEISPLLDESSEGEAKPIEMRAREFLDRWKVLGIDNAGVPALIVVSSHGDWIPVFLEAATGARVELSKGGWAELEESSGNVTLSWLIQEF